MKTAAIFMLCIVVSVSLAANNTTIYKKQRIVLGPIKIEQLTDKQKTMKNELVLFQKQTNQLKRKMMKLQKTIKLTKKTKLKKSVKSGGVHCDDNIKINKHF
jgi:hypothetical protein